jgi:integrase
MLPCVAGDLDAEWRVFWCEPQRTPAWYAGDPVLAGLPSLAEWARAHGTRPGQPVLLRSDGRVAAEVNAFLASSRMRGCSQATVRKYAYALGMWLGFLDATGRAWHGAGEDDVDEFKFWRMTDAANPARVAGGTILGNLIAINAFYEWAGPRYGVTNPVRRLEVTGRGPDETVERYAASPHVVRDRDVKWLDPAGYARWRDLGLRGLDLDGAEAEGWRGRNPQRDCAFADGLYGTGLRLHEWATILLAELPEDDPARGYFTRRLAAACAKGVRGRRYWMPRGVLADVLSYCEGERAAAVRRARAEGRYEKLTGLLRLERVLGARRVELRTEAGERRAVPLDVLTAGERARLFRQAAGGLAPVALWLNEDGLPRRPHGWQHTFTDANDRVARRGLNGLAVTAHMLRHSFALRWFSVGRLLYEQRFAHLSAEEMRDYRAQFGDTWYLVMTLLGHESVSTTMGTYLEPFRDLDVSLLIEHAQGAMMSSLMSEMFRDHPKVITDPLAVGATA